jgi:MtN3 and saliva related transmembrane protein
MLEIEFIRFKKGVMFKELYRKYMILIGVLGQFVFYAQFYHIITNKSARDVSLVGFISGLISVSSWLIYGIMLKDKPLIIANVVATIGAILTVGAIIFYH